MKFSILTLLIFCFNISFSQNNYTNDIEIINEKGFEFYSVLNQNDDNFSFSPFFLNNSMSLFYMGTKGGTALQISQFFEFNENQETNFNSYLKIQNQVKTRINFDNSFYHANALWYMDTFAIRNKFTKYSVQYWGDSAKYINSKLTAAKNINIINLWSLENTNSLVSTNLTEEDFENNIYMMLINSVAFSGTLANSFKSNISEPFYLDNYDRKTKNINYYLQKSYFKYTETENFKIVNIPFKGDSISMILIMPKSNKKITEFENEITYDNYKFWLSNLSLTQVILQIPKIEVNNSFKLKSKLEEMGLNTPFLVSTNFSSMISKLICLNQVVHSTSVTTEILDNLLEVETNLDKENNSFYANHPFVFVIKDNSTDLIYFIGHVINPTL